MRRAKLITALAGGIVAFEVAFSGCISMQMSDDDHPAAKVGAAALDIVTAPVQLPFWIVGLIVLSQYDYQMIDDNLNELEQDPGGFQAYLDDPHLDDVQGVTAYNHILRIRHLPPELAGQWARHPSPWIARAVQDRAGT